MFNKEDNQNIQKIELNNKRFYKQYNNISITPFFIVMLNNYYETKNMQEHIDFDNKITKYLNNCFEKKIKKQYNNTIVNLYKNGQIMIDNKLYELQDFYLVYKQNTKDFYLMCTDSNYHNNDISYDKAIKFIDTTAFIELIKNNNIQNNTIILKDNNALLTTIHNWDGYLHDKVCETDAIFNKQVLGNDAYE